MCAPAKLFGERACMHGIACSTRMGCLDRFVVNAVTTTLTTGKTGEWTDREKDDPDRSPQQ